MTQRLVPLAGLTSRKPPTPVPSEGRFQASCAELNQAQGEEKGGEARSPLSQLLKRVKSAVPGGGAICALLIHLPALWWWAVARAARTLLRLVSPPRAHAAFLSPPASQSPSREQPWSPRGFDQKWTRKEETHLFKPCGGYGADQCV